MTKKRFLLALALMLTAVGGAWAQGNTTPVNWNAATKTGSLTTPAGNVTLTVNYYGQYRLDSIPQGWEVKVNDANWNDSLKTYTEGNPQMRYIAAINETDSVELIPPAEVKPNVKSVTLVEPVTVQTVTIGNVTLQVVEGETWRQIAQRNPGVITADDDDNGHVYRDLDTVLRVGIAYIFPTDTYNSSLEYYWYEY